MDRVDDSVPRTIRGLYVVRTPEKSSYRQLGIGAELFFVTGHVMSAYHVSRASRVIFLDLGPLF